MLGLSPGGVSSAPRGAMPGISVGGRGKTWMDRVGDEVLVKRVASGNECALSDLYERYAGLVYGTGMRLLGDRETAEELVQRSSPRCGGTRPVSTRRGRALRPGSIA